MRLHALRSFSTLLLLRTCCAVSISSRSVPTPDRWIRYDLELPATMPAAGENLTTTTAVSKRTDVTVCEALGAVASCFVIGTGLYNIVNYLGNVIYDASQQQSCGTFKGSVGGVTYRYQANGKNCDTTAEKATISGAIEHHLKNIDGGKLCYTECLDLTHGGTWDGYLLIGPSSSFDANVYCGPQLSFGNCDSGGKNDFQ